MFYNYGLLAQVHIFLNILASPPIFLGTECRDVLRFATHQVRYESSLRRAIFLKMVI